MTTGDSSKPVDILLVEDNPGDARLAIEALNESTVPNTVHAVRDGEEAMAFLHQEGKYASAPRTDLILLDLNLPKKDGREVLAEIKENPDLKCIPVVVMTTSNAEDDIRKTYNLHVNCYVTKPVEFDHFMKVIKSLEDFWLATVRLPSR